MSKWYILIKYITKVGDEIMTREAWVLTAFVLYTAAVFGLAIVFIRSKNLSEYFLGGRKLNSWVGALSAQASDMSGWLLMGLPGAIYLAGTGRAWIAVGLAIGTACNWLFVAKRLRRYTITAGNAITLPQYFENRFRDTSHMLKMAAAVFFAIFFTIYTASGFRAAGILLTQLFDINYPTGVLIGAVFILIYTFIGGFLAVSWTDTIQGIMMLLAVMFIPIIAVSVMGGWGSVAAAIDPSMLDMMSDGAGGRIGIISIISDMAWGLGYFGMPHILVRFMAIKSEKQISRSAVIGIVWVLLALCSALMLGIVGRAFVPGLEPGTANSPETIFMQMVERIFLAPGAIIGFPLLGGLFLCGVFGAAKSTADSQLLVTSSAITGDIYNEINKEASDRHLVWVSRVVVLVVAVLAYYMALDLETTVMALVAMAWSGFGSAFGSVVILSLYWKRINKTGALLGMVTGGLTVIIWHYVPLIGGQTLGAATGLYSLVPGFIISFVSVVVGSLLSAPPVGEIEDEFERASVPQEG